MKQIVFVWIVVALAVVSCGAQAATIELFSVPDCGSCENAREYLDAMAAETGGVEIIEYNESQLGGKDFDYFNQTATRVGFSTAHVPVIVTERSYYVGFANSERDQTMIKALVKNAREVIQPPKPEDEAKVVMTVFWGIGCPHCAAAEAFLERIAPNYPDLLIERYEVNENETSRQLLFDVEDRLGFEASSLPVIIIGDWYHYSYGSDSVDGALIEAQIKKALGLEKQNVSNQTVPQTKTEVPFLGVVDLKEMGIPLSTVVIGLMDGFNPCALFVLTMLLSFMVYARSRPKMLMIGLTFVFISGFVYFLFMTALFSAIRAINEIRLVALVAGCIALTVGVINLKDFFFFKRGVSLSIPESKKPKLYKRMRELLKSQNMVHVFVSTIILAVVANSYELLCTSTFPVVYGALLNSQGLDTMTGMPYIALYNVFYVMPLLVIVLVFVKSLGGRKLNEEQGELLKSVSGFMMLGFGILLILDPMVLRNVLVAVSLIVFAVVVSLALAWLKKRFKIVKKTAEERTPEKKKAPKKKDGRSKKPKV